MLLIETIQLFPLARKGAASRDKHFEPESQLLGTQSLSSCKVVTEPKAKRLGFLLFWWIVNAVIVHRVPVKHTVVAYWSFQELVAFASDHLCDIKCPLCFCT